MQQSRKHRPRPGSKVSERKGNARRTDKVVSNLNPDPWGKISIGNKETIAANETARGDVEAPYCRVELFWTWL